MKLIVGKYEGTIYRERGGWTGALSAGFGPDGKRTRIKKKGRTKAAVKEKLVKAAADLDAGIKAAEDYKVADAAHVRPSGPVARTVTWSAPAGTRCAFT